MSILCRACGSTLTAPGKRLLMGAGDRACGYCSSPFHLESCECMCHDGAPVVERPVR